VCPVDTKDLLFALSGEELNLFLTGNQKLWRALNIIFSKTLNLLSNTGGS
jgi:hypothetical protein